uniref:NPHP4 n=1 Tax=Schmidtea mediterranea TaxID=79327 RepID=A0A0H3YJI8_SCHMD|nr:NPHP4 [Schmidtea mediterranea]
MDLRVLSEKHKYIPPPKERQGNTKADNLSFCIKLLDLDLSSRLVPDTNENIYIKASLFDFNYQSFFGKQWDSSTMENLNKHDDIFTMQCNQPIYFYTAFMDEYLSVIFEIIRYKTEDNQTCIGWCVFNLLKCTKVVTDLHSNKKSETISIPVYKGTARALFQLKGFPESDPRVKAFENSFLHLSINIHKAFDVCHTLIPEYFLVHEDDIISGLEVDNEGFCDFENPRLTKFKNYSIEKVKVFIEPSLMEFEKELLENINNDRLERDGKSFVKDASSLRIVERRLRVGVHNGIMYIEDNDTIFLNVQDPQIRRTSTRRPSSISKHEEHNCLTAKNSIEISMPNDQEFTIVFILEYSIAEPVYSDGRKDIGIMSPLPQHTYQVRWIVYQPFAQKNAVTFNDGIRLELDFSGGSIDAPENYLVYKPDSVLRKIEQGDGEFTAGEKNYSKLIAVMREKDPNEKEPSHSITISPANVADGSVEDEIKIKESRTLSEPPKPQTRKTKLTKSQKVNLDENVKVRDVENVQEAQIRAYQQFLMMQQETLKQESQRQISNSISAPPPILSVPFPNHMINMWYTKQLGEDKIVDYDVIDPYVVNDKGFTSMVQQNNLAFPLQMRSHHGLGLSRAIYSQIYAAGFQEILDCNGEHPFVIDPNQDQDNVVNFELEERDHKQCNEIIFQFMALTRFDVNGNSRPTKSVFFTFQFYRFPVISTDRLILDNIIDQISNYEKATPMILRKSESSGAPSVLPPGTMIKYMLDPAFMKPGEMISFIEYLNQQTLHVDVWDGDSLLLIGSCAVKLRNLCRQGKISVQSSFELDIISPVDIDDENSSKLSGRLHIRMANLGSVPSKKYNGLTLIAHPKKGLIIDASQIEGYSKASLSSSKLGGSLRDIYRTDDITGGHLGYSNIVVRPQPAIAKNRELSELIETKSHSKGSESMSPVKGPLMNEDIIRGTNHDEAKKLKRFKNTLRQLENENENINDQLLSEAKRSDKVEKQIILQTIQCYREQQKGEVIKKWLNGVIEKEIVIYPKFGCTEMFEVKIKNHFNIDSNVSIEINDSRYLVPITNNQELRALKSMFSITTVSENDLINFDAEKNIYQIFMRSKESVLIPFKYTNMALQADQSFASPAMSSPVRTPHKLASVDLEYQIVFRTAEDKLLSILRVKVVPQPPIIDQTFRFFHPEQSFLRRHIRMPPLHMIASHNEAIKILSRCTDSDVLSECPLKPIGTPHDIQLKVPCGPSPQVRQFLLALYIDKFLLKPIQVWHFTVHSKSRIDVVAHQGQSTNMTLLLKGASNTHNVQVFTSHPEEILVAPIENNSFSLSAHTTYELSLNLTPVKIGNRKFHVNVVDIESHTLIRSWVICATCKEPEISKMFEMQLPIGGGQVCKKRIGFQNPYPYQKRFYLSTDRPDLVLLKDTILTIEANQVENIGMIFVPIFQRCRQKIFVFINDEDGKNEETFALLVNYQ